MITSEELNKIVDLANSVPEEYRAKCFEILLTYSLRQKLPNVVQTNNETKPESGSPQEEQRKHVLPLDVRAFLGQYGLDETVVGRFFLIEGSEIRHIYKLKATKNAEKQTHHTLMMCLENALVNGQFEVSIEVMRKRCVTEDVYDSSNFKNNINNNSKFFKVEDDLITLSSEGKSELADLLEQLQEK